MPLPMNASAVQIPDIMQLGMVTINGVTFRKKVRIFTAKITRTALANAQFQGVIQLDTGPTPFLLSKLHASDTADTDTTTNIEEWFCSITDNESGYNWTDGSIPRSTLFGFKEFGNQLPMEVPLRSNTRVSITIQNQAAGVAAGDAHLSLVGWQLFPLA